MVAAFPFSEFDFPAQRTLSSTSSSQAGPDFALEGVKFPLALESNERDVTSLDDFVHSIEDLASQDAIIPLLNRNGGAILFRRTHAETPDDFSRIAHAFKIGTYHEEVSDYSLCSLRNGHEAHRSLVQLGNPVIRTLLAKNVATANEGPSTHHVRMHNEVSLSTSSATRTTAEIGPSS